MVSENTHLRHVELPDADLIFGSTAGMREIRTKVELALGDDAPVLILGESGTGKEVIGRFLHTHSARQNGPFAKVNCGAVPVSLLEVEIFGKDGDSQDDVRRNGAIDIAADGTLFLNEIGEMDMSLQQRLSRVLKPAHQRTRIQDSEEAGLNVRFVCASSFEGGIEASHEVWPQLFQCFAHRIRLLPLRERKQDIPQLCEYLVEKFARNFGRPVPKLSSYVLGAFQQWNWPGNIRELENWIARIVIFGTEEAIGFEFRRQLGGLAEPSLRRHRATRAGASYSRRLRRGTNQGPR